MPVAQQERDPATAWLRDNKAESQGLSIDKMPQLNASLERFSENIGIALARICGAGVSGASEKIETTTTFAMLGANEGNPSALLRSAALDARALMVFDEKIVDILINSIFGVDPTRDNGFSPAEAEPEAEPRARTELESRLLGEFTKALAGALQDAFAPVASFDLAYESVNTIEDENLLGPKDMPAVSAQYTVKTIAGAFRLLVVLPQALTTPLSEMFARGPDPSATKLDPNWTRKMEQGVTKARLTLTAILDEFEMSLGDVANLQVGGLLPLSNIGEGDIRIECVERGVFICKLGEHGERYALEVHDIIANNPDDEYYAG